MLKVRFIALVSSYLIQYFAFWVFEKERETERETERWRVRTRQSEREVDGE